MQVGEGLKAELICRGKIEQEDSNGNSLRNEKALVEQTLNILKEEYKTEVRMLDGLLERYHLEKQMMTAIPEEILKSQRNTGSSLLAWLPIECDIEN